MATKVDTRDDERAGGSSERDRLEPALLGALPVGARDVLERDAQRSCYPRHATIRYPGAATRPGIVLEGLIRAYVDAKDGREATVKYVRPGDAIGFGRPFAEDSGLGLQALEETTVLYFDTGQFEHELATEVEVARMVASSLARALAKSSDAVRAFAFGRVRQRVAEHLISLATRDPNGRLVAHVTQQGLADAVGSVRDVVARSLAELSNDGLVVTAHGRVEIIDEDALRHQATIA